MSFTDVFGGATLYPAGQTYLGLTFSVDEQLQWPIEQAIAGENVVASIMDLNATAAGLNVDIPDATQVSNGVQSIFNNVGANSITVRDAAGGTIISIGPGEAWVTYLADNSTVAGTWRIFQLGASVSVANASALAGAGLKAIASTLNQRVAPTSTAVTPVTWTDANRAQLTIWTGGVGILNLPTPGTVGSDWFAMVRNGGSGDLTLTPPAGLIDSAANLALAPGGSAIVVTDGTDFFTVGLGQSASGVFDFVEINVAGSGDFILSGVQLNRISYRFIGALTGNRNIVVPNTVQQYWVDNSTTGAFSLFVKTAAQVTPVEVLQNARNITYCDGTDVLQAESSTISFPVSIVQGGTGAITAATALANLGGAPLIRLINTNALSGLGGGGDLTADRNLVLDSDNLTTENVVDAATDTIGFYDNSAGQMRKTVIENIAPGDLKYKTADEPIVSDTTLNVDADLSGWTLEAASTYLVEGVLRVLPIAASNINTRHDYSGTISSSRLGLWAVGVGQLPTGSLNSVFNTNIAVQLLDLVDVNLVYINGIITTILTGTLDFQWAQAISQASNLTLQFGSSINVRKLA